MTTAHSHFAIRLAGPFIHGPLERAFAHLTALRHTRSMRRATPTAQQRPTAAKPTRSELFREMQHEKWLGKPCTHVVARSVARPKDLHRRPLQNPHA